MDIEQLIIRDLQQSGIEPRDIKARSLEMAERTTCGIVPSINGYVIPYYNIHGTALPFYRVRLFEYELKYRQVKGTSNHVYFPPNFDAVLKACKEPYIIITEGEKKAVKACKEGFPAVALGGVDAWRNRILLLPKGTEIGTHSYSKHLIGCKLPASDWDTSGINLDPIAMGLESLMDMMRVRKLTALIVFDSDDGTTADSWKVEVQRAAADLAFTLRRFGIPLRRIKQLILPKIEETDKTGLDDFLTLVPQGSKLLTDLITRKLRQRDGFPRHPNMESELAKKLQAGKMDRETAQHLSLSIITDLDSRGIRMFSEGESQLYYFESETARLMKVDFDQNGTQLQVTPFSKLLYTNYGLSTAVDLRLVKWMSTQYAAEDPVEPVAPYRVLARTPDDAVRYQINDGQYVKITGNIDKPIEVLHNGAENVLFESGVVEAINSEELLAEFEKRKTETLEPWWEDVLHEVRLKNHGRTAVLFSLLYYISPWLFRWRGTQLPAELVIGEAGSGKSTLCELRLTIISGQPNLRNAPADLKDWHASIVNTGGLHVTDNIQLTDKSIKQRLSDEICRLITEPDPHVEMRKYYTNTDLIRLRVDSVFAFTSITQPFSNSDLLQRAVILELDKMAHESSTGNVENPVISYDSSWKAAQISRFGGRTAWISHHLYVLHRLLDQVNLKWNPKYQAKHRLINLEQLLVLLADMFGLESAWIPDYLNSQIDESVVDADWSLEGLKTFAQLVAVSSVTDLRTLAVTLGSNPEMFVQKRFTSTDVATWSMQTEAYAECTGLTSPRRLGRYLQTHKALVAQVCGILEDKKVNNKITYRVRTLEGP